MAGRGGNNDGRGGSPKGRGGGGGGNGQNSKGGAGAKGPKTCNTCHKTGHLAADCRSTNGKVFKCINCNMNNHTTADCTRGGKGTHTQARRSKTETDIKPPKPCRFCQEFHLSKDCPNRAVQFTETRLDYDDTRMSNIFPVTTYSPACQYCGGQHLSTACPKLIQQPLDQYQYQRFPAAQPVQVQPQTTLWLACQEIEEEFITGDPWNDVMRYGQVDNNDYPTYYTQPVVAEMYYQQQQRMDLDGDVIMDWY
ncbi:hypothetical protein VTL71DRAFT_5663 [Oculimacula yallundae]|uniref:CCHC-type domain-containing protein n=1 Tax=Oculimacula yallundae TaxID=86028 RepID=A0ABR4BY47_9HELO